MDVSQVNQVPLLNIEDTHMYVLPFNNTKALFLSLFFSVLASPVEILVEYMSFGFVSS